MEEEVVAVMVVMVVMVVIKIENNLSTRFKVNIILLKMSVISLICVTKSHKVQNQDISNSN